MSRKPATPAALPKGCPGCGKTTLKVYRHDITAWVDEAPAEVLAWQCIYCGAIVGREGGSGKLVVEGYSRIILAPGELEGLTTYQTRRNRDRE